MPNGTLLKSSVARDRILGWIRDGRLAPGQRMPAEPALARMLNLHHTTVRRGLAELQAQGLIEKRPRVGNFIRGSRVSLVESQIAVVLHKWDSDQSPYRAFAGIATAELDDVIDRETYSLVMLTYDDHLLQGPASPGSVILRNGIKSVLLYAPDDPAQRPALQRLLDAGVKVVLINHAPAWDDLGLFSVKYDETGALRQIFARLVALGHQRIAVAFDAAWSDGFRDLYGGCVQALFREHRLGNLDEAVIQLPWKPELGARETAALAGLFERQPPTAIVVPDETHAMGVLRFCYRRGIRVPDDLSLASAQNFSPHAHPIPIASPPSDALARQGVRAAGEHLLAWLEGNRPAEREISLRCDINWTESVGPPGSGRSRSLGGGQP